MAGVEITYYSGTWSDDDRRVIHTALEHNGLEMTGDGVGNQKAWNLQIPPQLLLDSERLINDSGSLVGLLLAIIAMVKHFRKHKPDASIQVIIPTRIYIVNVDEPDAEGSVQAIAEDAQDGREDRTGDMAMPQLQVRERRPMTKRMCGG